MSKDRDLYRNHELVAVLEAEDKDYHFSVWRLEETVKTSYSGDRKVNGIKFTRDTDDENMYTSADEGTFEVSSILRKVLKISEGVHEYDGVEKTVITINRKLTKSLIAMANQVLASASEEGEEEEDKSQQNSELGKRERLRRAALEGGRQEGRIEEIMSEISMIEDESVKDESESVMESQNGESKPKTIKKVKERKPRASKELKPAKVPKAPRQPKQKKVVDYKRGKFNTRVNETDSFERISHISRDLNFECCDMCANRECIRATATGDAELLKKILSQKNKITTLFQHWGPEDYSLALLIAIERKDARIIDIILDEVNGRRQSMNNELGQNTLIPNLSYKIPDPFGISEIDTGFNDKYAYGVATRKVALGRGNREGVNAFSGDQFGPTWQEFTQEISEGIEVGFNTGSDLEYCKYHTEKFAAICPVDTFKKVISVTGWQLENFFALAVRSANVPLAAYISENLNKRGGFGLNDLHVKALTVSNADQLGNVRGASVKKKTMMGSFLILPIFCAAINPSLEIFEKMYESLDDKFVRDEKSSSTIFYAALNESPDILHYLLEAGVEFREANKQRMTPLMWASKLGRYKNIELLMAKGDNPKKKSREGYGAIHYAALGGHIQAIESLIKNGTPIDMPGKDRMTALAIAASQGHYECVKFLLSQGAKTVKKDKFKRTALILALRNCHGGCAALLVSHGCPVDEPDSSDNYPLHYACAYGCTESIDMLIKAGADPNAYTSWKLTPVAAAMLKNHFGALDILLKHPNIDVNCKDDNGRSLLSNSIRVLSEKSVNFATLLVKDHSADIGLADLSNKTPLHHLCNTHGGTFLRFYSYSVGTLRSLEAIKLEGQQKTKWFLDLADLLSGRSITNWSRLDSSNSTPLMLFFNQVPQLLAFTLLTIIPTRNEYDSSKGQYIKRYTDLHDHLDGDLLATKLRCEYIEKLLILIQSIIDEEERRIQSSITNELSSVELNTLSQFRIHNQSTVGLYLQAFRRAHFSALLQPALDMQNNNSKELSRKELEYGMASLSEQKKSCERIIHLLVRGLGLKPTETGSKPSAQSELLQYFSERWMNLYMVPPDKSSTLTKIGQNINQQTGFQQGSFGNNSGGFGFTGGFGFGGGFGQPGGRGLGGLGRGVRGGLGGRGGFGNVAGLFQPQTQFNNNATAVPTNYINFASTGVDQSVYEKMKEFRKYQIKEREELTLELLELLSESPNAEDSSRWEQQHAFCTTIMSMLSNVFFISSVNSLQLQTFEDPAYVKKNCSEMIESNITIGKKFISLAQLGTSEYRAQVVGSQSSLLRNFASVLPSIWNNLSSYIDLEQGEAGTAILLMEITTRLKFAEWIIAQFQVDDSTKSIIRGSLEDELNKVNKTETVLEKVAIEKSRRQYQRSIISTLHQQCTSTFEQFVFRAATVSSSAFNSLPVNQKLEIQNKASEIAIGVTESVIQKISIDYLPFWKQPLICMAADACEITYNGIPYISSQVTAEADLYKRKKLREDLTEYTISQIRCRVAYRKNLLENIHKLLLSTKEFRPEMTEVSKPEYDAADQLNKIDKESTSLWKLINLLLVKGLDSVPAHINSILVSQDDSSSLVSGESESQSLASRAIDEFIKIEVSDCLGLFKSAVDNGVFTDFKLNKHTMCLVLLAFQDALSSLFQVSQVLKLKPILTSIQKSKLEASFAVVNLCKHLFSNCFDPSKPYLERIAQMLDKTHFDSETNTEVKAIMDLEDYKLDTSTHPVFSLLSLLSFDDSFDIFKFFSVKNFELNQAELATIEAARAELIRALFFSALSIFDTQNRRSKFSTSELGVWHSLISNLLCKETNNQVISRHEIKEKNNEEKFLSLINEVNDLRRDTILYLSQFYIDRCNLRYEISDGKFIPEYLFKAYVSHGWVRSAREILLKIFENFFAVYGMITLDNPKIKNPLFYLAETCNFDKPVWASPERIHYEFFEYVLSKASNPNIIHMFEFDNKPCQNSLFEVSFSSYNGNFVRALLNKPDFNTQQLHAETNLDNLHHNLMFLECSEDIEFLRVYLSKVGGDERILEFRLNGYTPLLRTVISVQENKNGKHEFLSKNTEQFIQVLKLMIDAGCSVNAVYDNPKALEEEKVNKIPFKLKYLQLRNTLHMAMKKDPKYEVLQLLIKSGADVNHQDAQGDTPVHLLTRHYPEKIDILELLCQNGVNLNLLNHKHESCLFDVIRSGDMELVEKLNRAGASFEIVNYEELSPLTMLIESKDVSGIEHILKLGADVNFCDRFRRNSLHWAINFADHSANSSFEIEDILIRRGVEINKQDLLGRTPLHYPFVKISDYTATYHVDPIESVNSLLSKKNLKVDERDAFGNTPLLYAAQRGSLVSALYLIDKEAHINAENIEKNNSLAVAMISQHSHLAITLLNKGADWNTKVTVYHSQKRKNVYSRTLEMIKSHADNPPSLSQVEDYVKQELAKVDEEAEREHKGYNEITIMHGFRWAIRYDWQGLAYMILSRGYDIGEAVCATIHEKKFNYTFTLLTKREENEPYLFTDENGNNLIHLICLAAIEVKKDLLEKIFRVLVKKGISMTSANSLGQTALHCAAICGSQDMIRFLLEHNLKTDVKDNQGRTPMMLAAQNKNQTALMILFRETHNKGEVDREGRNILHYLCQMEPVDMIKYSENLVEVSEQVDCNLPDAYGKIPLHYILKDYYKEEPTIKLILKTRNLDCKDSKGQSLLMSALKHSAYDRILDHFMARGANTSSVDEFGRTALGYLLEKSTYSSHKKIQLIEKFAQKLSLSVNGVISVYYGVDPETKANRYIKISPIDYLLSSMEDKSDLIISLLKLGAKLDQPNDLGMKSVELLIKAGKLNLLSVIANRDYTRQSIDCSFRVKVNHGSKYEGKFFPGLCYLIHVNTHPDVIMELVRRGNDISKQDSNGISPLIYAVSERKFNYVSSLLRGQSEAGRQINLDIKVPKTSFLFDSQPKYTTPLCYAIKYRDFGLVQNMYLAGADLDFEAEQGRSPAYYLTRYNYQSERFAEFLRGYRDVENYEYQVASGKEIKRPRFQFKIKMTHKISEEKEEEFWADPLFFVIKNNIPLGNLILMLSCYPSVDFLHPFTNHSAFSLALYSNNVDHAKQILKLSTYETGFCQLRKHLISREDKRREAEKKIPFNTFCKVRSGGDKSDAETLPLHLLYNAKVKCSHVIRAISQGADFNIQEPPKNFNLVMLTILNNDMETLRAIEKCVLEGHSVRFDSTKTDNIGRSPIHIVVNSHKNGSFENVEMLKLLSKYYDVNKADTSGFPPIYYASLQDSGVMAEALEKLGAREYEVPFGIRRAPTSLITFATFPNHVPNFEEDAEAFINQSEQHANFLLATNKKSVEVDSCVPKNVKGTSSVVIGPNDTAYDIYMTKVDIKKGQFGGMVFYRMQLLHEMNRDVYILFTRYGRIGDNGQQQLTSFSKLEEAAIEFGKIFKSKSGNDWENVKDFQRIKKKYKLVKFNKVHEKELLHDFYSEYHEKDLPETSISDSVKAILKQVVNSKVLFSKVKSLNVDTGKLPLSKLNKGDLLQALNTLFEIKKVAQELQEERKVDVMDSDPEKIFELLDELAELTSEYFELIPNTQYARRACPPMESEATINQNIMMVRELLDVEVAVKILLGARLHIKEIHPIEYCYNSLNIKVIELDDLSVERTAILEYMSKTFEYGHPDGVKIFALERKGEAERFSKHLKTKNRKLLWHGSRAMNFLGVLNKGLRIAPPEAPTTGHMFGKGIYFSDTFVKSYNYTDSPLRIMLLCEVALGRSQELQQSKYITNLEPAYQSVLGVGINTPDPKKDVVIPNGMILPLGDLTRRENAEGILSLNYNEYVVYNEDQVKIRYMVCMNR